MAEPAILQALKLKGRATAEALASALRRPEAEVVDAVEALVHDGAAETTAMGFRLTEAGRAQLADALDAERAGLDQAALGALYDDFTAVNDEFKQMVTSWQMKSDTELNDHADAGYDRAVLARLDEVHNRLAPIADQAAALVPRLDTYRTRFDDAIGRVRAGDTEYVARPLIDSYHTVWFEFHEELIQASGRNRADEAAAGRGA